MKLLGKEKATFQILTNLLLWLAVGSLTYFAFALGLNANSKKFPLEEITAFIDAKQIVILFIACFVLFGLFALIGHKSTSDDDKKRAKYFSDLALDEWASAIINFGSLLLVCLTLGASKLYFVPVLICYAIGYYLKPE